MTYSIGALSGTANIALLALGGGSVGLNINGANNSTTYSGALNSAGSLSIGSGTLALSNVNSTYTGPIGINGGALFLTNSGVLSSAWQNSGRISVANGAAFIIPAASTPASSVRSASRVRS